MVENTGKALRADAFKLRPVNLPQPVRVATDAAERPVAVLMPRRQAVTAIAETWRLDDEWWRPKPVSRLYFVVRLASGQRLVLYKDLANGGWYSQPC